ncbi:MAG: hypothetical protein KDE51_04910 [Anaerolineales bacterium]|nr:hypothetical protein [Anaerolineales bacterium]
MTNQTDRHTFILRLWSATQTEWQWQGEIQEVHSGRITRIHSAGELLDYLQQTLHSHPPEQSKPGLR